MVSNHGPFPLYKGHPSSQSSINWNTQDGDKPKPCKNAYRQLTYQKCQHVMELPCPNLSIHGVALQSGAII